MTKKFYIYKEIVPNKKWVKLILKGKKIIEKPVNINEIPAEIRTERINIPFSRILNEWSKKRKRESLEKFLKKKKSLEADQN
ncbi:MAG: hypothetical protein QXP66_00870 [Candidatus Aenigmatarchaeota archaeon]